MPPDDTPVPEPKLERKPGRLDWKIAVPLTAIVILIASITYFGIGKFACVFKKCRAIEALDVVTVSQGMAAGYFRMVSDKDGIETDSIGGACVLIEHPLGGVCTQQSDCKGKVPSAIPKNKGPFGYCVESKCWIKVAEAHCWKSFKDPNQPPVLLTTGKLMKTPDVDLDSVPAELTQPGPPRRLNARVAACLNGKFHKDSTPPCAGRSGERDLRYGTPTTLKF